ncbi:MAG TPA: toll/interleukin-1 receptor domain-containing protein [Pyrinomonadaceae bacterium]|nr:toll/interleukin-1 receptor domain-containing protein [Pyrinomonadaceae bacterium]
MRVFISYRRDDSAGHSGRLAERLVKEFGAGSVFYDLETIGYGESFPERIRRAVAESDVLLAVIGRRWLTAADASGARRLDSPDDFVRIEIASALGRGSRVIPVLVQGAAMPRADELPSDLKALAERHAFELSDARWAYDTERLIDALRGKPVARPDKKRLRVLGAAGVALAAVLGVYFLNGYFRRVGQGFDACVREQFPGTPREREAKVPLGAKDYVALEPGRPKDGTLVIRLTDSGRDLGAVALGHVPGDPARKAEPGFKVEKVLGPDCQQVTDYDNEGVPGRKLYMANWDTLRLPLGGKTYRLRVGHHLDTDTVMANFSEAEPAATPPAP